MCLQMPGSSSEDSLALSRQILEDIGVAVTPGIDFGQGAEGHLRFSYANSLENIKEGMNRLDKYLKLQKSEINNDLNDLDAESFCISLSFSPLYLFTYFYITYFFVGIIGKLKILPVVYKNIAYNY